MGVCMVRASGCGWRFLCRVSLPFGPFSIIGVPHPRLPPGQAPSCARSGPTCVAPATTVSLTAAIWCGRASTAGATPTVRSPTPGPVTGTCSLRLLTRNATTGCALHHVTTCPLSRCLQVRRGPCSTRWCRRHLCHRHSAVSGDVGGVLLLAYVSGSGGGGWCRPAMHDAVAPTPLQHSPFFRRAQARTFHGAEPFMVPTPTQPCKEAVLALASDLSACLNIVLRVLEDRGTGTSSSAPAFDVLIVGAPHTRRDANLVL